MRFSDIDRRVLLAGAGACVAAAGARATAQVAIDRRSADLQPDGAGYEPPATLKAVFDLCRRMTAPVRVNGRGPYPFVIDTGANQSVISAGLAAQLGLSPGPLELLNTTTGAQLAPTTTARLTLGERDDDGVVLSILPQYAMGGVGMLGVNRLGGQRLIMDFARERLTVESAQRPLRNPDDVVVQATRLNGQLTVVEGDLAGTPVTAFLDSGAESTIGNLALKAMCARREPHQSWSDVPVISVSGDAVTATLGDVEGLRIGGMRLPTWPVAFADLHAFSLWRLVDKPALMVGVDVLSRFSVVSLDFARDEVRFRDLAQVWDTEAA
jgi:predicted aspartyl protease